MEARKYAMSPTKDIFINIMKTLHEKNMTNSLVYLISKGIIKVEDPKLIELYSNRAIEEYSNFWSYSDYLSKLLSSLFNGYETTWEFDSYRFALIVTLECNEDEEFQEAEEYGFKRFPVDITPAFKSKYLKFQDIVYNIFPEEYDMHTTRPMSISMQLTEACNLCCSYCFQINKSPKRMSFETAKKFIDGLLDNSFGNGYVNTDKNPAITLEFVGGEGLLEIELVDKILTYFVDKMANMNHPWLYRWSSYVSSNGVLYFEPNVQAILNKWDGLLEIAITLDGNKELHDLCRLFPDGRGSYDLAEAAVLDRLHKKKGPNTKLTLSPDNLTYLVPAIRNFIDLGLIHLWSNCIYEHQWTPEEAAVLYKELKEIADYLIDNNYSEYIDYSVFNEELYRPMREEDIQNWCGGDGSMLSVDPDGVMYNCLRYMASSLGNEREPLSIGTVDTCIGYTDKDKENIHCMKCIDRRSQSNDECFYCPIARGCSWCSAYNYQKYGTPNKRTTSICNTHKASALANVYYWNKYYASIGSKERLKMPVTYEMVSSIIPQQEYNMLLNL